MKYFICSISPIFFYFSDLKYMEMNCYTYWYRQEIFPQNREGMYLHPLILCKTHLTECFILHWLDVRKHLSGL